MRCSPSFIIATSMMLRTGPLDLTIGSWAAIMGAVILARAIDDPKLSDEVLEQARAWINAGISQQSASSPGRQISWDDGKRGGICRAAGSRSQWFGMRAKSG